MTILQMQNHSHSDSAVTEDPMEVISDMESSFDASQDIDIDLDLTGEIHPNEEDDYMVEDSRSFVGVDQIGEQEVHTSNDNEMIDDGYVEGSRDERSSDHNEDIDVAEYAQTNTYEDANVEDLTEGPYEPPSEFFNQGQQTEDSKAETRDSCTSDIDRKEQQSRSSSQNSRMDDPAWRKTVETNKDVRKGLMYDNQDKSSLVEQNDLYQVPDNTDNRSTELLPTTHDVSIAMLLDNSHTAHGEKESEDNPNKLGRVEDTFAFVSNKSSPATEIIPEQGSNPHLLDNEPIHERSNNLAGLEAIGSKEPNYLHPVMIIYQDNEISLFPPFDQDEEHDSTYFLQDERLASDTILNLLGACRSVLGESINVQEELMIDVEELGLHITEFAPESSKTTLAKLIDIYVHLQHYDGQDDPPALYIQLTTKPRFSHRLEYLLNAVAEEKGLSQTQLFTENEQDTGELGAGLAPGLHEPLNIDDPLDREVGTPQSLPGDQREDPPLVDKLQSAGGTASDPSDKSNAVTQAAETSSSFTLPGQRNEKVNIKPSIPVDSSLAGESGDANSESLQNIEPVSLSPPPQLTDSKAQDESISTVDDGDFNDYLNYNEQAHDTYRGSSTLQGDSLDPPRDGFLAPLDRGIPLDESGGHLKLVSGDIGKQMAQEALSAEVGLPSANTLKGRSVATLDNRLDYTASSEEPFESGTMRRSEEEDLNEHSFNGDADRVHTSHATDTTFRGKDDKALLLHGNRQLDSEVRATTGNALFETVVAGHNIVKDADRFEAEQADYSPNGSLHHEHQKTLDYVCENTELHQVKVTPVHGNDNSTAGIQQEKEFEPQISTDVVDQDQEDDNEITYDDDEDDGETSNDPSSAAHKADSSPGSLKRARSLDEGDAYMKTEEQIKSKRVRSR